MSGQALPKSRQQADLGGKGVEDRKRMTGKSKRCNLFKVKKKYFQGECFKRVFISMFSVYLTRRFGLII